MTAINASIPFGLAVAARQPVPVEDVDLTALVYDPNRQITLVRDGETDRCGLPGPLGSAVRRM